MPRISTWNSSWCNALSVTKEVFDLQLLEISTLSRKKYVSSWLVALITWLELEIGVLPRCLKRQVWICFCCFRFFYISCFFFHSLWSIFLDPFFFSSIVPSFPFFISVSLIFFSFRFYSFTYLFFLVNLFSLLEGMFFFLCWIFFFIGL